MTKKQTYTPDQIARRREQSRLYAQRPKDRARRRRYMATYWPDYEKRNAERLREERRLWREANRETILAKKRAYYHANKKRILAEHKKSRAADPEKYRAQKLRYREKNRKRLAQYTKDYYWRHPEVLAKHHADRRARLAGAEGTFTAPELRALMRKYKDCCGYCRKKCRLTADHRVPLVKGGTNYISNIMPACLSCNLRKHDSDEAVFRRRLALTQKKPLK